MSHRRSGFYSVPPNLERAKPARAPEDASAAPPVSREGVPAQGEHGLSRVVTSKAELVAVLRERKEALDISHETIDRLVGWSDRRSSKTLAPRPKKGLSATTLQALLQVLALDVAAVVLVADPEQAERMRPQWTPRGPTGPRPEVGALLSADTLAQRVLTFENIASEVTNVADGDDRDPGGSGAQGADQVGCGERSSKGS